MPAQAMCLHATRRVSCRARALRPISPSTRSSKRRATAGCDAVHPGYGFLSENADFARALAAAGLTFIGPSPETLELFGDKAAARKLARECDVPVLEGADQAATLQDAETFFDGLGAGEAIIIKAVAGGGGRGMRVVRDRSELASAWERCKSEAQSAFGVDALYIERYWQSVRHIEVQIVGDGKTIVHLGERECTIQRRHQKIVEMAPSPGLSPAVRDAMCDAAVSMARRVAYRGLGTFEFLLDTGSNEFVFIEANPRLQVEHTVSEEVFGVDLVKTQIRVADGAQLQNIGLVPAPLSRGAAVQFRVNMEKLMPDGNTRPTGGVLSGFGIPSGPGVRVDTFGYAGYRTNPRYDSLLAKVIAWSSEGMPDAIRRARRALREFRIDGVETNIPVLRAIVDNEDFLADRISTAFLETHIEPILAASAAFEPKPAAAERNKGRDVRDIDPLGVFGAAAAIDPPRAGIAHERQSAPTPEGLVPVPAPLQGTVIACSVAKGDRIHAGQQVLVIEAMKMEHLVASPVGGNRRRNARRARRHDLRRRGHAACRSVRRREYERGDGAGDRSGSYPRRSRRSAGATRGTARREQAGRRCAPSQDQSADDARKYRRSLRSRIPSSNMAVLRSRRNDSGARATNCAA